ncbi:hypothetical protein AS9A_2319 [Hoyosella subflava DQS3-9A1]|uniref:Uncharacterized protein n=2 Tax=Hoyosella TaxID=697025 RepID=F6ERV1_HOYSD|nr:hypothetical protein AS9A_2319 [Hoyosella subflava DQS3-9A1]
MIEDLEPFPDAPQVGEVSEPSTYWATPEMLEVPHELICEVSAQVEEVTIHGRTERVAHLGNGFTTMIPEGIDAMGETTLRGFLVWDRYLWIDYHTKPAGRVLVIERASLCRRANRTSTKHFGWYNVNHVGPARLHRGESVPVNHDVVSYALRVTPVGTQGE